jgi:two-component system response regulator DevR
MAPCHRGHRPTDVLRGTIGPLPAPVPVLVAHARLWARRELRRCFSQREGFIPIPAFQSPKQLPAQCQQMAPCVLVLDQSTLEDLNPTELLGALDCWRSVRVLVVGPEKDDEAIQSFIRMGCMGFASEQAAPSLLKKAVHALARGELWVDRRLITGVIQQLQYSLSSRQLTPREGEILRLIARGMKNRSIAEKLCISHETVRWHIRSLHSKLGVQDRLETAWYARTFLADEQPALVLEPASASAG